jgi:GT2 family glycosyltransferase
MFLSIIISTHNKLPYLKSMLSNLFSQIASLEIEVFVIADGCTDGTNLFLKNLKYNSTFSYICINQLGQASGRNIGIEHTNGDFVLFMDDDILTGPRYFENLLNSLKLHPNYIHSGSLFTVRIEAVESIFFQIENYQITPWEEVKGNICESNFLYGIPRSIKKRIGQKTVMNNVFCWWALVTGGNMCLHRSILENIGGFDKDFKGWGPEDLDLCYRAFCKNYKWMFNESCVLYHLNHERNSSSIGNSVMKNMIYLYKKYDRPNTIKAMMSFFNGVISLNTFNSICAKEVGLPTIELDEYYISLNDYLEKNQIINWKKKEA